MTDAARLRSLPAIGIFCGLAAGAWLGAAEAPTKLVTIGLSPVVVSLAMVVGVFLARWSLPALIQGTSYVGADLRQAPHLIVWAVLAGSLWAVANTLTIFAVRDVGLSIAFPLWNSNSLLGILWGVVLFDELRGANARRFSCLTAQAQQRRPVSGKLARCAAPLLMPWRRASTPSRSAARSRAFRARPAGIATSR